MKCLYCGKGLPLLRRLTGGEFCSDSHRQQYQQEYDQLALSRLLQAKAVTAATKAGKNAPEPVPDLVSQLPLEKNTGHKETSEFSKHPEPSQPSEASGQLGEVHPEIPVHRAAPPAKEPDEPAPLTGLLIRKFSPAEPDSVAAPGFDEIIAIPQPASPALNIDPQVCVINPAPPFAARLSVAPHLPDSRKGVRLDHRDFQNLQPTAAVSVNLLPSTLPLCHQPLPYAPPIARPEPGRPLSPAEGVAFPLPAALPIAPSEVPVIKNKLPASDQSSPTRGQGSTHLAQVRPESARRDSSVEELLHLGSAIESSNQRVWNRPPRQSESVQKQPEKIEPHV